MLCSGAIVQILVYWWCEEVVAGGAPWAPDVLS
jgi:hypothetical protein